MIGNRPDTTSVQPPVEGAGDAPAGGAAPVRRQPWRLILGTAAGMVLGAALGWTLLTLAMSLMFLLGLFFAMLFGLIIGAVVFRLAKPGRPYGRPALWVATVAVTLSACLTSLYKEAASYPSDFTQQVIGDYRRYRLYIGKGEFERVEGELHAFITRYLAEEYPPGGWRGYLRMASQAPMIKVEIPSQIRTFTVRPPAPRWLWWTRTLLAPALLAFAVYSMLAPLRNATDPQRRPAADA
jgi:amino acid transporter